MLRIKEFAQFYLRVLRENAPNGVLIIATYCQDKVTVSTGQISDGRLFSFVNR